MTFQPATGAKDLNPKQVERNQLLCNELSKIYKLWGYEEVSPPRVERIQTLIAGGAIPNRDIVRLVSNEPLGLRPEMTASIARAASTRLANRKRPLRLWASGTIFETSETPDQGIGIEENLVSGVELFGIKGIEAELELLSLLMEAMGSLKLNQSHNPSLLIGHIGLMNIILNSIKEEIKEEVKRALIKYDLLQLNKIELDPNEREKIKRINTLKGNPLEVLELFSNLYGNQQVIDRLNKLFKIILPIAESKGINITLDPTFQPHFELYNGIVFQLISQTSSYPIVIATGGRYDAIVERCGAKEKDAAGVGFSFAIDKLREINIGENLIADTVESTLITYSSEAKLEAAFKLQSKLHNTGNRAIIELEPCLDRNHARLLMNDRGCNRLEWLE